MNSDKMQIAKALVDSGAVKINLVDLFTWTSGIKSPVYCDNRLLIGFTDYRNAVVEALIAKASEFGEYDYIAGTATAGIPWASILADRLAKPLCYVRSEPKAHGAGKQVEGNLEPGKRVLLVEDHFSTGGSSINSAEALRKEASANVVGVLAITSYDLLKMKMKMEEAQLSYASVLTFADIANYAKETGLINEAGVGQIADFLNSLN